MADIATDIITYCVADTTLNALITGRMYYTQDSQMGTVPYPYIFFYLIADNDRQTYLNKDAANPLFQFNMLAGTMADLNALDAALRARLIPDGIRSNVSLTNFTVDIIIPENSRDMSTGKDFYFRSRDIQFIYQR